MPDFPHMDSSQEFPHARNVNVYKFDNEFDYSRYDYDQMKITVCTVPWDMGEAHIGARTISGIGNVVYFGSKANRDAWFAAIPNNECFRFETKYKKLHRDLYIDVPIPFDVASTYNYVVVEYHLFANDNSPVRYENANGHRKWFWFVREVEMLSVNTTRLHILDDAFQTWIYDIDISGMILERGHAPMFATRADAYLANPVLNNDYLLTEDVNYGEADTVKSSINHVFNAGQMLACIASTSQPNATWGTKAGGDWRTPANPYYFTDGVPSCRVIAINVSDLDDFLTNVTSDYPQYKQTVQGVFFVSRELVTLTNEFTFAGITCHGVSTTRKSFDFTTLSKVQFGYPTQYADIAKLYTTPYAHLELVDENGDTTFVKVEDSTGSFSISAALNIAYPFVNIEAHIIGAGGSNTKQLSFANITSRSFNIGGKWYETLRSWKVPTFAVILDAEHEYDYNTHFDRAQRVIDYTTTYDNSVANATTAQANANASADTAQTNTGILTTAEKGNADATADTLIDNTAIQVEANETITETSNAAAAQDTYLSNAYQYAIQNWDNAYTTNTANNQVDAAYASAAISAASGAIGSTISGAASGAALGPAGAAAGAIGGLISGAISGATTIAQTTVSANLTTTQADAANATNSGKVSETQTNNTDRTTNQNDANTDNTDTANTASTGVSANSAATTKANATRSKTAQDTAATNTNATEKANALRAYNTEVANAGRTRSQAQSAITNDTAQAALRAPFVYGAFADGDNATVKPQALFLNVVTQSRSAIRAAGDEFLRYGYMLDMQWPFNGNWNVGKYFTYWKLKDFWVSNLNVPDMYMDKIRFFLFGGVTVWRNPDDIGKRSIYENFN